MKESDAMSLKMARDASAFSDPMIFKLKYWDKREDLLREYPYDECINRINPFNGKKVQSQSDYELYITCLAVKRIADDEHAEELAKQVQVNAPTKKKRRVLSSLVAIIVILSTIVGIPRISDAMDSMRSASYDLGYLAAKEDIAYSVPEDTEALRQDLIDSQARIDELEDGLEELNDLVKERDEQINDLKSQLSNLEDQSSPPVGAPPETTPNEAISVIVYITESGEKYHKNGCQYLKHSRIPIEKTVAVDRGYEPCSVCNPQ